MAFAAGFTGFLAGAFGAFLIIFVFFAGAAFFLGAAFFAGFAFAAGLFLAFTASFFSTFGFAADLGYFSGSLTY